MIKDFDDSYLELKLNELFFEVFKITGSIDYNQLEYQKIHQWDSLNHINLMLGIEKKFNCQIPKGSVLQLTNYNKIKEFLISLSKLNSDEKSQHTDGSDKKIYRGLNNIYYDETKISYIDGNNGHLLYRGYKIDHLVNNYSAEEVMYLLIEGNLPDNENLKKFKTNLENERYLSKYVIKFLKTNAKKYSLMTCIKSCLALITEELSTYSSKKQLICLTSKIPLLIGNYLSIVNSNKEFSFDKNISHGDFLAKCIFQKLKIQTNYVKMLEKMSIIQFEHESNASAFAARVATGTENSFGNAILAATSTFEGKLHGGAIKLVADMLENITIENVDKYIKDRTKQNLPIYGFGHRVYRTEDPRSVILKNLLDEFYRDKKNKTILEILAKTKQEMSEFIKHGIDINVDFYSSVCLKSLNINKNLFLPIFIANRVVGWGVHIIEQKMNNILIRPRLKYSEIIE
ncbi:citrate/2-methylcitrate synthase [Pigmentibacter sp. JX0631]|uniref:citrate/2-methylcitrate synthase n=1 Tax=Pigmentibacter sp. JX0631 TaxID=2976982 RepID=UPI0024685600|nr:citrate/2-methylcitrate synthase [Pigmentibacter sp. JX0631]WGL60469.1 citrate/2-methylcitrate synthase [Pigmentibacter sp. JX0631]